MMGTPESDFHIDADLVAKLLKAQHPDLADLPIVPAGSGWDNVMYRLGDKLSVRLPRRHLAAKLILRELTWLPIIAPDLALPVPTPLRVGTPAADYPCHWGVLPWLPGEPADLSLPNTNQARSFGQFLRSLHRPAPPDAPRNDFRGIPLRSRATVVEERLERLERSTDLITPTLRRHWRSALDSTTEFRPMWLHGDLHPQNILVDDGQIAGIIDWGDITSGDVATDLSAIWMLFATDEARDEALSEYGDVPSRTRQRAIGWAILFGAVLLETGMVNNPRHADLGERILRRMNRA